MGEKMNIKDAAKATGLSLWELRNGVRFGKYPALKCGLGRGKYILDIDLLNDRINELMLKNVKQEQVSNQDSDVKIRRIV